MKQSYLPEKLRRFGAYEVTPPVCEVKLDANESFLTLPAPLKEKMMQAVAGVALNRYPDPMAGKACAAFAALYGVRPEMVTAGNGSDELIGVVISALLEQGKRAMVVTPDFSMYKFYCDLAEITCEQYEKSAELAFDPDDIIRAARERAVDLLIFSNPCNPTGQGLTREQVRRIVRAVDALVVLDEAYMDFWDQSLIAEAAAYPNLIVLKTCSKCIGLAALRMGFAIANQTLTDALRKAKSPYNVNALTQAAAAAILKERDFLANCREQILLSRQTLVQGLDDLARAYPGLIHPYPTVTNFVLLATPKADALYQYLKAHGVLIRKLGETLLRVSCGGERENTIFLTRFEQALKEAAR